MRNARVRGPIAVDRGKRRLDHGFGLRPRHQRGFVEPQRQAPEFLDAEDARDRLAAEPPRGKRSQLRALVLAEAARSLSIVERGVVEAERVADEQARVELGRIQARPGERRRPARGAPARRSCPARAATASGAFGRQQLGLVLGDQRVDDLVQRLALHHLGQIVERQVDAVVGDAALREIVGADALGAVARADLVLAARRRAPCRCLVFSAS